jgi:hypothetical protein
MKKRKFRIHISAGESVDLEAAAYSIKKDKGTTVVESISDSKVVGYYVPSAIVGFDDVTPKNKPPLDPGQQQKLGRQFDLSDD